MSREKQWRTKDDEKKTWPEGPWTAEPDKVQWLDDTTDLDCLAVRNRGFWCGYVGVQHGHPAFGDNYQRHEGSIEVHGCLTFSGACQKTKDPATGVCHVPLPGRGEVHWFGFDCAHSGDLDPSHIKCNEEFHARHPEFGPYRDLAVYRTLDYVRSQCAKLARQLASMKVTS